MMVDALRHRADVTLAAVRMARGQLRAAKAEIESGDCGDTIGAWCDVLHALEATADLAHAVAAFAARDPP